MIPWRTDCENGHPEDTIDRTKPGAMSSVNEARKLVAQCNILGDEIDTVLEKGRYTAENQ